MSVTYAGLVPAFIGGPAGVKAPVVESTVKIVMLSEPRFATYANSPEASNVSATGLVPAGAVEADVRAPVATSIASTEMLPSIAFVTYANRPCGSTAIEVGPSPLLTGGVSGVKPPLA